MNETNEVSNILENYQDISRLETVLRIHKEGNISTEEAVNLITGDRNYMVTNTLKKIEEKMVKRATSVPSWQPYINYPSVTYTSDSTVGSYTYDPAGIPGSIGTP
jgi:hypothetical protein